jgi:hypothetical protein
VAGSERRRRLIWLIWARVCVSTLLMGSAVILQITKPGSLPIDPFFFLIGLTYSLSVLYVTSLGYVDRSPWLIDLQFALDACTVTAFIYFTGGVTSYFALLYVLPIIGVASLKFRSGSMRVAILSAGLYGAVAVAAYMGGPGTSAACGCTTCGRCCPRCAWPRWPSAPTPSHWWRWRCSPGRSQNACRAPTRGSRTHRWRWPTCRPSISTSSTA